MTTIQEVKQGVSGKAAVQLEKLESLIAHCAGAQREIDSFKSVVDADKEEMLDILPALGLNHLEVPGVAKAVHVEGTQLRLHKESLVAAMKAEGVSQAKLNRILLAGHKSYPQNYIRFTLEGAE